MANTGWTRTEALRKYSSRVRGFIEHEQYGAHTLTIRVFSQTMEVRVIIYDTPGEEFVLIDYVTLDGVEDKLLFKTLQDYSTNKLTDRLITKRDIWLKVHEVNKQNINSK